ncbi:MAG: (2Fe-2S)-binding protein [Opitutales bacterium]|nr:(2Fe-2S)-binding protein [Opitutales bacterium]
MAEIRLHPIGESSQAPTGTRLLDVLLDHKCSVMMACGGQAICATCHVYIEQGKEHLNPISDREKRTLGLITGANPHSRLSCQTQICGEGVVEVRLPEGLYLESMNDLEALIGKRTNVPILHPRDGRVLIAKNKIITRTRILELSEVDPETFNFDLTT